MFVVVLYLQAFAILSQFLVFPVTYWIFWVFYLLFFWHCCIPASFLRYQQQLLLFHLSPSASEIWSQKLGEWDNNQDLMASSHQMDWKNILRNEKNKCIKKLRVTWLVLPLSVFHHQVLQTSQSWLSCQTGREIMYFFKLH